MKSTLGLCVYSGTNSEDLEKSFHSIVTFQSIKPDRIFLTQDGCVHDNVLNFIEEIKKTCDIPITVSVNNERKGLTKNLNQMIKNCKTEYFIRMDTDDISYVDRLEKQISFMERNKNIDILGSNCVEIDSNGNFLRNRICPEYHKDIINQLPWYNPITHPSVLLRTNSIKQIGGYNEDFITSQDYELWFRSYAKGLHFHNLQNILLKYRMDDKYSNRKNLNYRLNDIKIKWKGLKEGKFALFNYLSLFLPIMTWLIPKKLFKLFKYLDPRNKSKHSSL